MAEHLTDTHDIYVGQRNTERDKFGPFDNKYKLISCQLSGLEQSEIKYLARVHNALPRIELITVRSCTVTIKLRVFTQ